MNSILNLSGRRRLPLVRQVEAAECGLASLAMIAAYHGYEVDLSTLRLRFGLSMKGVTLKTLIEIAAGVDLAGRAVRCEPEELSELSLPAILHWGTNHFVVLKSVSGKRAVIHDPASGVQKVSRAELSSKFTGVALELLPTYAFRRKREVNPLKLSTLICPSVDAWKGIVQAIVLSVIIELMLLSSPFYMQMVIDESIMKGDASLLSVLAAAFSAVLFFRVLAQVFRELTLQFLSKTFSFEMQARIFNHLIRLPLEWFHKRQVGDIQSRFQALQPIQSFLAGGALGGAIDGALGALVLGLLTFYSWRLTALVAACLITICIVRATTIQIRRRFAGDYIVAQANENSRFLETIRAAETVKAGSAETTRDSQQRNAMAKTVNSSIRSGNIDIATKQLEQLLNGLTDIIVVFFGAREVLGGSLSVGALTAFMAYKAQFFSRFTNLVDQLIAWRLLALQLERLSDIALSPKESRIDGGGYEGDVGGRIECRGLTFQYAFGEQPVLSGLDLSIAPGDYIAITGPSGCGKSTLLKLLTGLYTPTYGQVFVDGKPIAAWNLRSLRRQLAVVSQDDQLLSGSVAENIAFFDEAIDMPHVIGCAHAAHIHADIVAMPMGYETLVGDMGSTLSGGQKQRLLIARALYRRPRVLVLDEGTSQLDVANEAAINDSLSQLPITRIVVAHRPETIRRAKRVVSLHGGRIVTDEQKVEVPLERGDVQTCSLIG